MPLPRGTYDIDLRIGVPRAQLVDWKISCAGAEQAGTLGQSFEDYKERRLAQLTKEREQQARAVQPPPTTTIVVAPPIGRAAIARVRTPIGRAQVIVQPAPVVVREAQPPAVEVEAFDPEQAPPVTELPPGDLGQGVLPARTRVVTQADGVCSITAVADDPNVSAFFSVTRVRDLGVEEAERKQVVYVAAVDTRGRMTKQLVAYGADPAAKQRRLEAQAKLRAEAEARRGAELARQRELEVTVNLERRQRADAEAEQRRQRRAAEEAQRKIRLDEEAAQRKIREDQRRIALEAERQRVAKAKWEAEAPARARAELLIKQTEISIKWRLTIMAWLVGECHADPGRRGRLVAAREQREREARLRIEIRLEIERIERERLIRIRMEEDRRERETALAEARARDEARRIEKERLRAEAHERQERERIAYIENTRLRTAKLDAERAERENRDAIERARREREATELAELELRRTNEAIRVRSTMVGSLIGFGAKLRTPRPAPMQENPGGAPFDGAEWSSGRWEWISLRGEWVWRGGGWRDSTRFGPSTPRGEAVVHTDTVIVAPPTPTVIVAPPVTTTVVSHPTVITPGVVIEVGGDARPRPTYRPAPRENYRPRPSPSYQPRPSDKRPTYQRVPKKRRDDDKK